MDVFLYIVGIVIAVALLAVALVATILCYLAYCSKHPMRKLRAEIVVVVLVSAVSLVIRLVIGFASLPHSEIIGGTESVLHGILSTVAGLMFDAPMDLSDFALVNGITVCLYYGLIAYAGFVFLSVITVGVSYDFYSRIQTMLIRFRKHCTYYIFTSITNDSLVLAEDIKKHEQEKRHSFVIIFFESSDESFSRKNPLHRKIMQDGFFYFSDPRCTDKGETVCLLSKFKFKHKHCAKDDVGENHNKLFYVFALDDSGDYEGNNADVVFDDMQATLKAYVYRKKDVAYYGIPTVLNYYVLTSGEVNYESYTRRSEQIICEHVSGLPETVVRCGGDDGKSGTLKDYIRSDIQINVVNEAALSSHNLVLARNAHLNGLGDNAFALDSAPDKHGAYRVAVIGFGKTGQYAMGELYTHTARLIKNPNGYAPTQFIADIFDSNIDEKSGLFAYNHPLFRCIDGKTDGIADTASVTAHAKNIDGEAIKVLRAEYTEMTKAKPAAAQAFIDEKMAFPIAVMHKGNCFGYPFFAEAGTETATSAAIENGIRDIVVALGNDERNIDMANIIIDSFRRLFLRAELDGKKLELPHITIYVNIIDERNMALINWRWKEDEKLFTLPYADDENGKVGSAPRLSVIPFGFREQMYSYSSFVEDYRERIYNYGYNLLSGILEANDGDKEQKKSGYAEFKTSINADYNVYRNNEQAIDQWMTIPQFLRLSNRSALAFAINYYKYKQTHNGVLTDEDWDYLVRLEHERWNRFFISHGWIYAKYYKNINFEGMSADDKKAAKKSEKLLRRGVRQHDCLCPFDVMLDDGTKDYDRGNVELGFVKGIVFGGN